MPADLERLKQHISLLEYLQRHNWKPCRAGSRQELVGLCPLHQETRPSFYVNAAKNLFYCHGCGQGGDLARLAAQSHPIPMLVAAPMTTKEFRGLPQADQERLKNPVYCGFEGCVRAAVDSIPRGEPHSLQIVCDLSEEYSVQVLKLFHKLRGRSEEVKQRCHGFVFRG